MILRLNMPLVNPSLRGGTMLKWHKNEGEAIEFGDDICTVTIDDFAVLRRTARATLLTGRKAKRLKSDLETRTGQVSVDVVVTASDKGVLRRILKNAGDKVEIEDTLAVISTDSESDSPLPDSWEDAPTMRVIGNMSTEAGVL